MCEGLAPQFEESTAAVIHVDGDIAYAGKTDEYELAAASLTRLGDAPGVPPERMICVAGSHRIDRSRQKCCFDGVRPWLRCAVGRVLIR